MLLRITHETNLTYDVPINETIMELRMAPRQEQDQHRLSFRLAIGPAAPVTGYFDWLGNLVHAFTISAFHSQIRIVATSVVQTHRAAADSALLTDRWPVLPESLDYSVRDFTRFSTAIGDTADLRKLTETLKPGDGCSLGELADRMLKVIDSEFAYEKGVTTATSSISEVLDLRRGVCQDFAHLMIGMARTLGIPARYVSGVLHPYGERYRGYTQTHAWCELYFPSIGWVGFDPTNKCRINDHFVRVAVGRDYRDVPPNRGMFKGTGKEDMTVIVGTEQLPNVPSGLPAERIEGLGIRTVSGETIHSSDHANQQIAQQQQQSKDGDGLHRQQQQQQQQ